MECPNKSIPEFLILAQKFRNTDFADNDERHELFINYPLSLKDSILIFFYRFWVGGLFLQILESRLLLDSFNGA